MHVKSQWPVSSIQTDFNTYYTKYIEQMAPEILDFTHDKRNYQRRKDLWVDIKLLVWSIWCVVSDTNNRLLLAWPQSKIV